MEKVVVKKSDVETDMRTLEQQSKKDVLWLIVGLAATVFSCSGMAQDWGVCFGLAGMVVSLGEILKLRAESKAYADLETLHAAIVAVENAIDQQ